MICPYCGNENPDNLEICEFCGGPLNTPIDESAAEPYSPEPEVTIIKNVPEIEPPYFEPAPPPQAPPVRSGNRIWWLVGCFVLIFLFLCCAVAALIAFRSLNGLGSFLPSAMTSVPAFIPLETVPIAVVPPASIPNATSSHTPAQDVLFSDDFSDPSSGWDRVDETDFYTDYFSGTYRITVYSDMYDSWANPDSNLFTDVSIAVDATKYAGPDDNDFDVMCRYQASDQFYYGVISSDGYYGIFKVTPETSSQLGASEMQSSNNINQGFAANHIRFDCIGDVFTLSVNGQQVDQQTDNEFPSGNVGLIAGTYDTPGTDILFDNFSVIKP